MTGTAAITWWGHATVTIADAGVRVLTDPVLVGRIAHLHRRGGPTPAEECARADVILISHLHLDHLHPPSIRRCSRSATILLPHGGSPLLRGISAGRVAEVEPGDHFRFGAIDIEVVYAEHDGRRGPWSPLVGPAVGYVVTGSARTYFAGDTNIFAGMRALGDLDVAVLPVWGWGPTLGPGHLDPARAAEALRLLAPRTAVPVHYGTFWPYGMDRFRAHRFIDPGHEFARHAGILTPEVDARVLLPGETLVVAR